MFFKDTPRVLRCTPFHNQHPCCSMEHNTNEVTRQSHTAHTVQHKIHPDFSCLHASFHKLKLMDTTWYNNTYKYACRLSICTNIIAFIIEQNESYPRTVLTSLSLHRTSCTWKPPRCSCMCKRYSPNFPLPPKALVDASAFEQNKKDIKHISFTSPVQGAACASCVGYMLALSNIWEDDPFSVPKLFCFTSSRYDLTLQ
jgi:hypothetical protein